MCVEASNLSSSSVTTLTCTLINQIMSRTIPFKGQTALNVSVPAVSH